LSLGNLYKAIEQIESGGDPDALSSKGARGLMQVMPSTARKPGYGIRPAKNDSKEEYVRVGKDYAKAMYKKFDGDIEAVLAAYNMGPGATEKWIATGRDKSKLPKETRNYIPKVKKELTKLNKGNQGRVQMAGVVTKIPELFKLGSRIYKATSPKIANLLRGKGFVKLTAKQAAKQAGKAQKITERLAKKLDSKGIPQVPMGQTASKVKPKVKLKAKPKAKPKDPDADLGPVIQPKPGSEKALRDAAYTKKFRPKPKVTPKPKVKVKPKTQTNKQTQKNRNKEAVKQAANKQGQNVPRSTKKEDPFKRMAKVTSTAKPKKPLSTFQKYKPGLIAGTIGGLGGAAVLNQLNKKKPQGPVKVGSNTSKPKVTAKPKLKNDRAEFAAAVKKMPTTAKPKLKNDRAEFAAAVKKMPKPKSTKKAVPKKENKGFLGFKKISGPDDYSTGMRKYETPFGILEVDSTPIEVNEDRKAGGKVSKKKGGMIKRSMGGSAKPRKKTVFRRGGGKALRGMGKAIYSNKPY
jgi:hypothetical protein